MPSSAGLVSRTLDKPADSRRSGRGARGGGSFSQARLLIVGVRVARAVSPKPIKAPLLASVVGVAAELAGSVLGVSLLVAALCLAVGLIALGRRGRSRAHRLGWTIAMSMIPALSVGGGLSEWDERLLEVPLVGLAVLWTGGAGPWPARRPAVPAYGLSAVFAADCRA